MYWYGSDNAITYTPEDLILFKESPFACWMERLTLENPDHGISPDTDNKPVRKSTELLHNIASILNAQNRTANSMAWEDFVHVGESLPDGSVPERANMADRLHGEGGDVLVVQQKMGDTYTDGPQRRARTIEAMQSGTRFIINGQLSIGPLSAFVDLLIRSPGISEFGDYLYIPCNTHQETTLHSTFRLCFAADLLHGLQGKLPPQMLIIPDCGELTSLHTEDDIHHFRAVKHRFMSAQLSFRKHRMPDPVESSHFGRWSDCARDLINSRAVARDYQAQQSAAAESGNVETLHSPDDQVAAEYDVEHFHVEADKRHVTAFDSRLITNAEMR